MSLREDYRAMARGLMGCGWCRSMSDVNAMVGEMCRAAYGPRQFTPHEWCTQAGICVNWWNTGSQLVARGFAARIRVPRDTWERWVRNAPPLKAFAPVKDPGPDWGKG